jgi:hypothetical protein
MELFPRRVFVAVCVHVAAASSGARAVGAGADAAVFDDFLGCRYNVNGFTADTVPHIFAPALPAAIFQMASKSVAN